MGFPSPASDYVGQQLSPVVLCNIGGDSKVLETDIGFAVIEPCVKTCEGDVLLILSDVPTELAKLMDKALITDDGEAIEGLRLQKWRCWKWRRSLSTE
jgi:hypothetical protein